MMPLVTSVGFIFIQRFIVSTAYGMQHTALEILMIGLKTKNQSLWIPCLIIFKISDDRRST